MYGNSPVRDGSSAPELSADERRHLRRELTSVAARTRELLPGEFVVGSELGSDAGTPRATVAVQPPVGAPVSATCPLENGVAIDETEREDIAVGLAASAALQVKRAVDGPTQTAR